MPCSMSSATSGSKKIKCSRALFCKHWLSVFVEPASGNEYRARTGVGKDVIDLLECLRGVDGNVDRAQTQNGKIGDGPLGTILGQ